MQSLAGPTANIGGRSPSIIGEAPVLRGALAGKGATCIVEPGKRGNGEGGERKKRLFMSCMHIQAETGEKSKTLSAVNGFQVSSPEPSRKSRCPKAGRLPFNRGGKGRMKHVARKSSQRKGSSQGEIMGPAVDGNHPGWPGPGTPP